MNDPTKCVYNKTVIINRAVSGSGKTTLSRCVTDALRAKGLSVSVHSTDSFFMRDGRYVFEIESLNRYHAQNLANFTADLEAGKDVVICDNMNLLPWQSQPYTDAARRYNYRILFLNFLPRELEKHLAAQVITPEKPDAHGLSKELLERFIQNFNDYNDLLDRNTVRDIKRHHVFVWNHFDKEAMDIGELAPYFDSDVVITIRPEEYQEMKKTLADAVLKVIMDSDEELGRREIKKHYLLTWYGITDIRAALGLEYSDGPVLGALRTGAFTDAIILGYTNSSKKGFTAAMRTEWEKLHSMPLEERMAYPRDKAQLIVDAVCNTEGAHKIFLDYLNSASLPVRIRLEPQKLEYLNDAQGIDRAAQLALQLAFQDEDEKDITCFLSPGTPVMAYTWAMVSRMNPQLHLHVISSSEPRNPPEEIKLPNNMFLRSISATRSIPSTTFDVTIHLLGTETNIPQFFSLIQFPSKKHWFISSASAESGKETALRHLLPKGASMETIRVDAFVPAQTRKAVESIIRSLPQTYRIGVNLTGGTKLMFAGGLNACDELSNAEPFYIDIKQHNVTFLRNGAGIPFKRANEIDGFFTASGYDIVTPGYWNDNPFREARKDLTLKLWQNRKELGMLYSTKAFRDYRSKPGKMDEFDFEAKKTHVSLKNNHAELTLCGKSIPVPSCTDFASYISGGWLEEYAFMQLKPLLDGGRIRDLRIGLEILPSGQKKMPGDMPYGEFDCAFTDGVRLFLVECKAGCMKQEYIQKLENNLKTYGGISAKGFFVTSFPVTNPSHRRRIDEAKTIRCIPTNRCNPEGMMKALYN